MENNSAQNNPDYGSTGGRPQTPAGNNINSNISQHQTSPSERENSAEPAQQTNGINTPTVNQQNNETAANQIATRANWLSLIATKIGRKSNDLSIWAIAVNIVLIVATFMLYMLTREATDAATKSANAAENTYKEQKYNDSVLLVRDSIKNHNDSINDAIASFKQDFKDSSRFELERTSTQAQIDAFKQQVSSFYAVNKPYLQVTQIAYKGVENGLVGLDIVIANLGNYPVKIRIGKMFSITDTIPPNPYNHYIKSILEANDVKIYVSNNTPRSFPIFALSKQLYLSKNGIEKAEPNIYIYGNFKYTNLITNKTSDNGYEFLIEVTIDSKNNINFKYLKEQ